jgi:hypothetical protein
MAFLSINAQTVKITFTASDTLKYNDVLILVEQGGRTIIGKLHEKISILSGKPINVAFQNLMPKPTPLINLMVTKDTVINLENDLLPEVKVYSKKWVTVQTLNGFEYKPYLDDDYKYKPIFNALEKLPFIVVDQESIKYKDGQKILFMVNGKQRPGITSWDDLLKQIPAKEVYKVKMITELPPQIKNKSYSVILDIHTLDVNAYGYLFVPTLIADTRQNLNPNVNSTFLKKRADFSLNAGYFPDNYKLPMSIKIVKNGQQISQSLIDQKFKQRNLLLESALGYRIDSSTQVSLSSNLSIQNIANESLGSTSDAPEKSSYLLNKNINYKLGVGYLRTKREGVGSGLGFLFNYSPITQYYDNRFSDINIDSNRVAYYAPTKEYLVEYFYNNLKNEKHKLSYVIQSYYSQTKQSTRLEHRFAPTSDFETLYLSEDSINIYQQSVSLFMQNVFIKNKKSLTLNTALEYYSINSNQHRERSFVLPNISIQLKTLLKQNRSIKYRLNFDYLKPNIDFLLSNKQFENTYEVRIGSSNIVPEKSISAFVEYIGAGKVQMSNSVLYKYGYDRLRFITKYDSSLNLLVSESMNNSNSHFFQYKLNVSKWFSRKLRLNASTSLSYLITHNKNIDFKNSGWAIFFTGSGTYNLPKNFGVSFYIRAINNLYSDQGSKTGYFNYHVIFGKLFYKNKLSTSLIFENFILKNRKMSARYTFNENEYITNLTRPYRLIKFRLSYRFSTIKTNRSAEKYLPEKSKEASLQL